MALFFIVGENDLARARMAIIANAIDRALSNGRIEIWVQPTNSLLLFDERRHERKWRELVGGSTVAICATVKKPQISIVQAQGCFVRNNISPTHFFNVRSNELEELLRSHGLHWKDGAADSCRVYQRQMGDITVQEWVSQFERVGDRVAGEAILRMLRVVPTKSLLMNYLPIRGIPKGEDLPIAVLSRMGKSGAALSPILRNILDREVMVISEAIEVFSKRQSKQPLHVFEDGLWTGIELQRVLDSLLGNVAFGKVPKLSSPELLRKREIVLHFPIQTDLGQESAKALLKHYNLTNITVQFDQPMELISVLTPEAHERFNDATYNFGSVLHNSIPVEHVIPHFSSVEYAWLDPVTAARTRLMIEKLGAELWPKTHVGSKILPFGANNIGSTLVFEHGVARAVLPAYWSSEKVTHANGKVKAWRPITPEQSAV